jgi:DNA-nicking Smr family endonuclease
MKKKYKIDCLDFDKMTFADLYDRKREPSFADLEADFQPDPDDSSQPAIDKKNQRRHPHQPQPVKIEPQSQLDLHGLTAEEAENKTRNYLLTQKKYGRSVVRIITGKGLHSPGQGGVLRDLVEQILLDGVKNGSLSRFNWEKQNKEQSGAVVVQLR